MKNTIFITFIIFVMFSGCTNNINIKEVNCKDIDAIKENIKIITDADSVIIYKKKIKEELYFQEINSVLILIYNATTETLDFKSLPIQKYKGFDSFLEIEEKLKSESSIFAENLINNCDLSGYDDLTIEFIKLDINNKPMYRFICHYRELLTNDN